MGKALGFPFVLPRTVEAANGSVYRVLAFWRSGVFPKPKFWWFGRTAVPIADHRGRAVTPAVHARCVAPAALVTTDLTIRHEDVRIRYLARLPTALTRHASLGGLAAPISVFVIRAIGLWTEALRRAAPGGVGATCKARVAIVTEDELRRAANPRGRVPKVEEGVVADATYVSAAATCIANHAKLCSCAYPRYVFPYVNGENSRHRSQATLRSEDPASELGGEIQRTDEVGRTNSTY
jgi:hypothetical protein